MEIPVDEMRIMRKSRSVGDRRAVLCGFGSVILSLLVAGCGGSTVISQPAAAPGFLPAAGTYTSAQTVTLTDSSAGASIYYTLDGTNPTTGSTPYSAPINIVATTTIKAIATAPGFSTSAIASGTYTIVLPDDIVCWGDSMTSGDQGIVDIGRYPTILQEEVTPTVFNQGVGGQTSTQIGVRQGGIPTYVAVMGGSIPAYGDGGVTVTFPTGYEPLTDPEIHTSGWILGVEGELTLSAALPDGTFTFTRTSVGDSPVSAPGTPQYIPITPYSRFVSIFWEGRNNLFKTSAGPWGQAQIVSDIATQVAALPTGQNYLVLSVANEDIPEEWSDGSRYSTITGLNSTLSSIYGNYYLDIRSILVNAYNPSLPTDESDYLNDVVPTSLRAIVAQGTLGGNIGTADTSFSVNLTSGSLMAWEILTIDSENIRILEASGTTVTSATRGYGGTLAPHLAGAAVSGSNPTHLNKQGYTVVADAIATKLAAISGSGKYDTPDSTMPATIVSSKPAPR